MERIRTVDSISELQGLLESVRSRGQRVGFVPTMGFLHAGHQSLMRSAAAENDTVVASIFVNPLQFAADEDLTDYPRDLKRDTELSLEAGVDLLFVPTVDELYADGPVLTQVAVPRLATRWEGATRPEHFAGVATVVSKLFNIVGPCSAYFGEKDFQQLAIIRRLVVDLSFPIRVVGCPIVREPDGLAMSSRNSYLTPPERAAATVLKRALEAGSDAVRDGQTSPGAVADVMARVVSSEALAELDYAVAVDPLTLEVPDRLGDEVRLLIAVQLGRPRLIDNTLVQQN